MAARVVLVALAWRGAMSCETTNPNLEGLGISACAVRTLDGPDGPERVVCSCPFTGCEVGDDPLEGRCRMEASGVAIVLAIALSGTALLILCAWLACCRGTGCTFTLPCRGGWLCWHRQLLAQRDGQEVYGGGGKPVSPPQGGVEEAASPHVIETITVPTVLPPGGFQSPAVPEEPSRRRAARSVKIDEGRNEIAPYMP